MSKRYALAGSIFGRRSDLASTSIVTLTASGTAHTKGAWATLFTAPADLCGFWLSVANPQAGATNTDSSMLLEVGIGNTGDAVDATVIPNVTLGHLGLRVIEYFPLFVRSGERVAGRIQAAVVSDTVGLIFVMNYAPRPPFWAGFAGCDSIGVDTATSGPVTGDLTDSAWDEAIASTARAYKALTFHACLPPADTTSQGATIRVEVGIGGSGAEQILGEWLAETVTTETVLSVLGPPFIAVPIPAGSRLAIRKTTNDDLSGHLLGWW